MAAVNDPINTGKALLLISSQLQSHVCVRFQFSGSQKPGSQKANPHLPSFTCCQGFKESKQNCVKIIFCFCSSEDFLFLVPYANHLDCNLSIKTPKLQPAEIASAVLRDLRRKTRRQSSKKPRDREAASCPPVPLDSRCFPEGPVTCQCGCPSPRSGGSAC